MGRSRNIETYRKSRDSNRNFLLAQNVVALRRALLPYSAADGAGYYSPLPDWRAYIWNVEYCDISPMAIDFVRRPAAAKRPLYLPKKPVWARRLPTNIRTRRRGLNEIRTQRFSTDKHRRLDWGGDMCILTPRGKRPVRRLLQKEDSAKIRKSGCI